MVSPARVAALLRELDFRPSRALGQNFLVDGNILDVILRTADLRPEDGAMEIGPGLGILTEALLERCARVVAVEKDRRLHAFLAEHFEEARRAGRLMLIHGDAVELPHEVWEGYGARKVVSNLPYASASRILVGLASAPQPPASMTVTVQLEVARRLAAEAGTSARGLLSVLVQCVYRVEVAHVISPSCFLPRPAVKSAVVRLTRREPEATAVLETGYMELVRRAFERRRKQMLNVLSGAGAGPALSAGAALDILRAAGLDPRARPEQLSVAQWRALLAALKTAKGAGG